MQLPFTVEEFLNVFKQYNFAIWPIQIVAYALAAVILILAIKKTLVPGMIIAGILASLWLWMGVVYHILFFAAINKAAYIFGTLFILQGALFIFAGIARKRLVFGYTSNASWITGTLFILYAMVIYPIIGAFAGHGWPHSPSFGVTPCPATIFTFGILLWTVKRVPKYLLIIPLIWSFIGFSAAILLGIYEDTGLLVAGIITTLFLIVRDRKGRKVKQDK